MAAFVQDLAYAWRTLRRSPAFAIVAILTLGLGIGATTTIFTIVNGVLLRPLPVYRQPDRIANLRVDFGVGAQSLPVMSPGDFRDYQQRSQRRTTPPKSSASSSTSAHDIARPVRPQIYTPFGSGGRLAVVVRASLDPLTLVTTAGVLMAAALAGCYVPARRATHVNPIVALKTD